MDDGNGKLVKTLATTGSGGLEDMLVGCLWLNNHLITVSLGGLFSVFSESDLDGAPITFSGHMKSASSLVCLLESDRKLILTSSYDGILVKWIQGVGFSCKLKRADNSQIKCFAAVENEIIISGFDNQVTNQASVF